MIDIIINNKETIVRLIEFKYRYGWILGIVLGYIQHKLLSCILGINFGYNIGFSLINHSQHCVIHVIIDKHNSGGRTLYQAADEIICIIYLPIEEDSLFWF